MHRWWEGRGNERFWLEITDRKDLGVDLRAPQFGDEDRDVWTYSLVREVQDGDIVFHYWKPQRAIWAWSRAAGTWWEEDIVWSSMTSKDAGTPAYQRPGWRIGLTDFMELESPITLDDIRADEPALRALASALEASVGSPTYFPIAFSELRPARMQQAYLTKLPASVVSHFTSLAVAEGEADSSSPDIPLSETTDPGLSMGVPYRQADEEAATSSRDPFSVDPAIVERGIRAHAATQNALADWVEKAGLDPRSPLPHEPNFDLAWWQGDTAWVVEVKSLTISNEEKQLRLGLGQVLRYRQLFASTGPAVAVLAVEREPTDPTWDGLCKELEVRLVWPDSFDSRLGELITGL